MPKQNKDSLEKDSAILERALARFDGCVTAESKNRQLAIDDLKFAYGDQWPKAAKDIRGKERPCLTFNRIPAFTRQVINDIRQVRPAMKFRGIDSDADPETAEIISGMARAIEAGSNAESAYDWAAKYAVLMGWGYFRINIEYADDAGFDLNITIERVRNPFSVYLDSNRKKHDGSDSAFAFVTKMLPKEEFETKYPDAIGDWSGQGEVGTHKEKWFSDSDARISEYWEFDEKEETISQMPDGQILPGNIDGAIQARQITKKNLTQYIITGSEILERNPQPGRYIPIIPVLGEEDDIEGEILYKGMVRDLQDPMRQYNYMRTARVERIALTPKAPWVGAKGQFKSPKWRTANTNNQAYLEYEIVAGQPPPKRQDPVNMDMGLIQECQTSAEELKAITGIHDSSLGDHSNEIAGTAIKQRQMRSDISNFHYVDNLSKAMRHCGRILADLIPKVYSGERMVRILKPGGEDELVQVGKEYVDEKTQKSRFYNLQTGKYDVAVDIGPSFATQRQEAVESMLDLAGKFPDAVPIIGDLIAKNMDFPDSQEIAERLKLLLPPEIASEENPQIKQMMQQSQQKQQQLEQFLEQLMNRVREQDVELKSRSEENEIKAAEVERKARADFSKLQKDITELELKYTTNIPGALV